MSSTRNFNQTYLSICLLCVFIIFATDGTINEGNGDNLVVDTTSGLLKGGVGDKTAGKDRTIYWFRSIPYAEPPVGDLRFEPPVPKKRWNNVLDVSGDSPECIQHFVFTKGVEDCLYLKIYTTRLPSHRGKKQPVLTFIHGGAFFFGSPNMTESNPDYLLDEDVVIVVLQYRLGAFGFLTTEDLVLPGNNALRDIILALKWLKNNIEAFGGDSNRITIQGQSAGSALVSYLLQINQAKGLFSRAIMQSGTSLCLWAYFRRGLEFTKRVAEDLKLNYRDTRDLVDQLKTVDAEALVKSQGTWQLKLIEDNNVRDGLLLGPVMEPDHAGALLSGKSYEELEEGHFHSVPILIGHTSLEAYLNTIPGILRFYLVRYDADASELVPIGMHVSNSDIKKMIGRIIKEKYFENKIIAFTTPEIQKFISDDQFERPIRESARLYSARSPVYFYKFSYKGILSGVTHRTSYGVGHSEDLAYLFDYNRYGTESDYLTRKRMVKLWTNFVKTGNPTPEKDRLLQNIKWPSNKRSSDFYTLVIDKDLKVLKNDNYENVTFWKDLYNTYGEGIDTY